MPAPEPVAQEPVAEEPVAEQPIAETSEPVDSSAEEVEDFEPYLKESTEEPMAAVEPESPQQHTIEFDLSKPPVQPPLTSEPTPAPEPVAQEPVRPTPQPEPVAQEPVAETSEPLSEPEAFEPYLKSSASEEQPPIELPKPNLGTAAKQESTEPQLTPEEQQRRAANRIMRLKDLGSRLKTPSGISELENEPRTSAGT